MTVNGEAATFTQRDWGQYDEDRELVVTPPHGLPARTGMSVVVTYTARPADVVIGPFGFSEWRSTPTGVVVWNEPSPASQWWFPPTTTPATRRRTTSG